MITLNNRINLLINTNKHLYKRSTTLLTSPHVFPFVDGICCHKLIQTFGVPIIKSVITNKSVLWYPLPWFQCPPSTTFCCSFRQIRIMTEYNPVTLHITFNVRTFHVFIDEQHHQTNMRVVLNHNISKKHQQVDMHVVMVNLLFKQVYQHLMFCQIDIGKSTHYTNHNVRTLQLQRTRFRGLFR